VPLLATQILWINILTDAAPALALGVDPPPDNVMSRSPRRLTDRVIDAEMQHGIGFVGHRQRRPVGKRAPQAGAHACRSS
jgi:P-type Ca2+ transporter type 2C